jgi:hypothetical protein
MYTCSSSNMTLGVTQQQTIKQANKTMIIFFQISVLLAHQWLAFRLLLDALVSLFLHLLERSAQDLQFATGLYQLIDNYVEFWCSRNDLYSLEGSLEVATNLFDLYISLNGVDFYQIYAKLDNMGGPSSHLTMGPICCFGTIWSIKNFGRNCTGKK